MEPTVRTGWGALLALGVCCAALGCAKSGSGGSKRPPAFVRLTNGNPNGEDDDPTVAVDSAGNVHVVWFSDRDGTKDLYYMHSTAIHPVAGTIDWSAPLQVTQLDPLSYPPPTQGDNFPSVVVEPDGSVEIAWFRWNLANECHIEFLRSDGTPTGWATAMELDVTTGANFDRFPDLVRVAPNDLRIYFSSTTRAVPGVDTIFVTTSADDGDSWTLPLAVPSLSITGEQASFPVVLSAATNCFMAAFDRWTIGITNVLDPSTDVLYATSTDGLLWTVQEVSHDLADDFADVTPSLFTDHAGSPHVTWTSAAFGDPAGDTVEIAVSDIAQYPSATHVIGPAVGTADHSPHIVALTVGNQQVYALFWVRIVSGHNQAGYRILSTL